MKNQQAQLKTLAIIIAFLAMNNWLWAATPTDPIKIWGGPGPGSESLSITEGLNSRTPTYSCSLDRKVTNVTETEIVPFVPETPNGISVIICPGGGYSDLSYDVEGTDVAEWLNTIGITAFVLKYRLPEDGHDNQQDVPLQDAQRAVRTIRYNATTWGLASNKIGIMGFSAGGHVASSLATMYDKSVYSRIDQIDDVSARPDFVVMMYALISMEDDITHDGARSNLLGSVTTELINEFSTYMHVDSNCPPAFMGTAESDGSVDSDNSVRYNQACIDAGVSSEIHLYGDGRHGIGICRIQESDTEFAQWPAQCETWINSLDFTTNLKDVKEGAEFVTYYNQNSCELCLKLISSPTEIIGDAKLSIIDLTGREIYSSIVNGSDLSSEMKFDMNSVINKSGLFISVVTYGSKVYSNKLIVNK